jgi:hypothetical protein
VRHFFLAMGWYLLYNNLHIDIHTGEPGIDDLDDSWLHHSYSYASIVRDDIDTADALSGMSLPVSVLVIIIII